MDNDEIAERLVRTEIICCVSGLISGLQEVMYAPNFEDAIGSADDLLDLLSRTDYEEAGHEHIDECQNADDLEELAGDDWREVFEAAIDPDMASDEVIAEWWEAEYGGDTSEPFIDSYGNHYDSGQQFIDEHRAELNEEFLSGEPYEYMNLADRRQFLNAAKAKLKELVPDWAQFCLDYGVDTDEHVSEVYEHWVVTQWLASKLAARGETTSEIAGLTIWGRCATGQAISMDWVIQDIAKELEV